MLKYFIFLLVLIMCPWCNDTSANPKNYTTKNIIKIDGAINSPGNYTYNNPVSLLVVMAKAGGPTALALTNKIRIKRANGHTSIFDIDDYAKNSSHQLLPMIQPGDSVYVPSNKSSKIPQQLHVKRLHANLITLRAKLINKKAIQLDGAVYHPGQYDWSSELNLLDVLSNADGTTDDADIEHIKIISYSKKGHKQIKEFNLAQFINRGGKFDQLPRIRVGDIIHVPEYNGKDSSNTQSQRSSYIPSIYIFGEVGSPGRYAFNPMMGFLDFLSAAKGPSKNANISDIRIIHHDAVRLKISKVNLGLFFKTGDPSLLPNLVPQDAIYIPSIHEKHIS